ncbi:MAG: hypothetical protein R6V10_03935, partial [bacterium]
VPDADECIVGIMAMHVLAGEEHPLYLYGQGYGAGAGLEARLSALLFAFTGPDGKTLKLAALFLWIIMVLLGWRLASRMLGRRTGAICLSLLAVSPQMAEWSMKLRGGHLSALVFLVLSAWLGWRLLEKKGQNGLVMSGAFGATAALAGWAQPVAAPAATSLVLVAFMFLLGWKKYAQGLLIMGGAFCIALIAYFTMPGEAVWLSPASGLYRNMYGLYLLILKILPRVFTPYQDPIAFEPSLLIWVVALVWGVFVIIAFYFSLRHLVRHRIKKRLSRALLFLDVTVVLCVLAALFVDLTALAPRHLLATYPFLCLLAASLFWRFEKERKIKTAAVLYAVLVIAGMAANSAVLLDSSFHNPGLGVRMPAKSVKQTVKWLEEKGFYKVYSADTDFTWNLIFTSREKIIARSWNRRERYPLYVNQVDRTARSGVPMAVVFPYPEGPLKKPVMKKLMGLPGAKATKVAPQVKVVHGISGADLLQYFPPARND